MLRLKTAGMGAMKQRSRLPSSIKERGTVVLLGKVKKWAAELPALPKRFLHTLEVLAERFVSSVWEILSGLQVRKESAAASPVPAPGADEDGSAAAATPPLPPLPPLPDSPLLAEELGIVGDVAEPANTRLCRTLR